MNTIQTSKLLMGAILSLFILSLIVLINSQRENRNLKGELRTQRARASSLITQKSLRERHVDRLTKEVAMITREKMDIEKTLAGITKDFEEQEAEVRKLQQSNFSLKEYKLMGESYAAINEELERNLDEVGIQLADERSKNGILDQAVNSLEKRNAELSDELYCTKWFAIKPHSMEGLGKKDKPTLVARKTRKLRTTLEVPVNVKHISFVVKGPNGEILNDAAGVVSVAESEISPGALASLAPLYSGESTRTIEMKFSPSNRMEKGLYTIDIMAQGKFVGSMKTHLR